MPSEILIPQHLLDEIHAHLEDAYPDEGAGFLLGIPDGELRRVLTILKLSNAREDSARHNRYLLTPQDVLCGEQTADQLGLALLGVFHSHPDHPNRPSDFDRDWAMPWFSYLITSIRGGKAAQSRAWRLREDRAGFEAEQLTILAA